MKSGQITAVRQDHRQKKRYHIEVEHEYAFSVHEDILIKYKLFRGTAIDENLREEVLCAEERRQAYLACLRLLGIKPRTKRQLKSHLLAKGYSEQVAEDVCGQLANQGYIDDLAYARQWVEERLRLKPRSARMLRMELAQKGLEKAIVDEALQAVTPEDELAAARALVEKKLRRCAGRPGPEEEKKLLAMLARKGFSSPILWQVRSELRRRGESG